MTKITYIFLLVGLSLYNCADSGQKLPEIMKPADYLETHPLESSQIPIHISVSENSLIRVANENDKLFRFEGKLDGDNYEYKISKNGDIKLSNDGQKFFVKLPLDVDFDVNKGFVSKFLNVKSVSGQIDLDLSIRPIITSDWQIKTQTVLEDYTWVTPPSMNAFGTSVNLTWLTNTLIGNLKQIVTEKIDDQIASTDVLRSKAVEIWDLLQTSQPQLPNSSIKAILQPTELKTTPIKMRDTSIYMDIEVISRLMLLSDSSSIKNDPVPLPPLQVQSYLDDKTEIKLYSFIDYEEIKNQLDKYVVGQSYTVSNRTFTIESLDLFPSGNELGIEVDLSGAVKGKVYLKGKPKYDDQTETFSIDDVEYSMQSRNVLLKSAQWLLRSTITNLIESKSKININQKIEEYLHLLNENFEIYELPYGVKAHAEAERIRVRDVFVDEDGVHVQIEAQGELKISY